MYDINKINKITETANKIYYNEFKKFFKRHIKNDMIIEKDRKIQSIRIKNISDAQKLYNNEGFYIILSDYKYSDNPCRFVLKEKINESIVELKAVYRGESSHRQTRIIGHILKKHYNGDDKNFMIVDGKIGIDINESPYSNYIWKVILYSTPGCLQNIRIQAELAFDDVYGKPIFSNR